MKKILMTGGGTAGHVMPNLALFNDLKKSGYEIVYVGSKKGIEKTLVTNENIKYYSISSGKLRRYFSFQNFLDVFKVGVGIIQSFFIVMKEKPDVVFSKGGFVSVPVVIGAFLNFRKIIIHESDLSMGLANKIASKFAGKILTTFMFTTRVSKKAVWTGTPIRMELLKGDRKKALTFTGLNDDKPFIYLTGGSLGSKKLNDTLISALDDLTKDFNIIHQCGKNKYTEGLNYEGYRQYEFIKSELKDIFALSDIVISRAGSNSIFELLMLAKPNILIPLSKKASRGDQIENANVFYVEEFSYVIEEEDLNKKSFIDAVHEVYKNREKYIATMNEKNKECGNHRIIEEIVNM